MKYELWVTIFSAIIRRIIFVIEIQKANRLALNIRISMIHGQGE